MGSEINMFILGHHSKTDGPETVGEKTSFHGNPRDNKNGMTIV
jgi:hypothetical protein